MAMREMTIVATRARAEEAAEADRLEAEADRLEALARG
jgi:hypothetical protein